MDRLIANASKPEDLFRALAGICSSYGELSRIQFYCRRRVPDEVVCFIDRKVKGNLAGVTRAPHGIVFGYDSVYLVEGVPENLRCSTRSDGHLIVPACNTCSAQGRPR